MNKGSRDNSKDICLEFAERDTRFKYIKQDVNVNIKMYKSDKIKMYNYSKLT